ncbi:MULTISPECIES: dethiobiotin synthase [unclassified Candidatus Frackibacter]|uniref:dethiobiotin synthase n=1 Tax=unclassified Candidatus Frackibacter TaxID=2648818 RepID=UPI000796F68B|nr:MULTISPECIES: dethiobiotin synthase [unclassified Candidatus Frackibacter]KXS43035.1 MAG: dethiobiotin synthetase [Candidatus Frackibacter sp. T328-2]SDC17875.1 dethiobiotin synthetase [Candidatus Frackibacter sp. WG11]SEM44173.1 dethiobiotin synthetase [Candidatus Frackibacter sp. WG12]SFL46685.1 dethiobiotin synthetase [Candidatus Frackibacter sp. WG13]
MQKGFFITGTDTGVGKTVLTAGLIDGLRQKGYDIGVMKPFQSGAIKKEDELLAPDIEFVLEMTGLKGDDKLTYDLMNPVRLSPPLAPSVAAEIEGAEVRIEKVKFAYQRLQEQHQALVVEGAGGLMVPLTDNFLIPDLVKLLNLPVIIVARPSLGTINHTVLTVKVAKELGLNVLGVIINGLKEEEVGVAEETNPEIIAELAQIPILGIVPYINELNDRSREVNLGEIVAQNVDLDRLSDKLHQNERS